MTIRDALHEALLIVLCVLSAVALLAMTTGCASPAPLPACGKWNATPIIKNDQIVAIVIDREGLEQLHALIHGLANGTCRLAGRETPV